MNNKKILIAVSLVVSVSLIIVLTLILSFSSNKKDLDNNDETTSVTPTGWSSSFTIEQGRACWQKIGENMPGRWVYLGGEVETENEIFINLLVNADFVSYGWGGNGFDVTGTWKYEQGNLYLTFAKDNLYWDVSDEAEVISTYEDTRFDAQSNTLQVPLGFIQRTEDFTGECDLETFHINMLNYFLHKQSELLPSND